MTVHFTETWLEGYAQAYEGYLYNHEAFVQMQRRGITKYRSFYALDASAKIILGKVHFFKKDHLENNAYHSPRKSPFGSFEMHAQLTAEQIDDFVQFVYEKLREDQPSAIHILHHAAVYDPGPTMLIKESLMKAGFTLKATIPNHHIGVHAYSLTEKMYSMEKRRLQKCQKTGFSFKEEDLSTLANVYDFVLACRKERGWGLSMNLAALQKTVSAFPENYKLFSVYDGDRRIAATVAIVVNSRILYNFYPASLLLYQSYSPTVLLIEGLYQYCQQKGMEILDLGTSASHALQRFKVHMGGEISYKYEFVYHFNDSRGQMRDTGC